jgi:NAD(P)-dependent dehydrogenase (short-subunit alcohol dehydrogenase family)
MKLAGTDALVTGANRGLGKSLVKALEQAGVSRIHAGVRGRFQPPSHHTQSAVRPLKLDITNQTQVEDATVTARGVTLLVNNAGLLPRGDAMSISEAGLRAALEVNLIGTWRMSLAFAPVIAANGGGVIVNVLSLISLQNVPPFAAYSAAKHAAWDMTQSLQSGLAGSGVQIVPCFPAGINTDMLNGVDVAKADPDDVAIQIVEGIQMGKTKIFPDPVSARIGRGLLGGD